MDGINTAYRYTEHELEVGKLLEKTYGGTVEMAPVFEGKLQGVRAADYVYNGERWDLKQLSLSNKDAIRNAVKAKKGKIQAENFIIELRDDFRDYEKAEQQAKHVLSDYYNTAHVKRIMFLQRGKFISVWERP